MSWVNVSHYHVSTPNNPKPSNGLDPLSRVMMLKASDSSRELTDDFGIAVKEQAG
jgi:hypothetical protein